MLMNTNTLVIIPVFNEEKNVENLIKDLKNNFKNIYFVDNNSNDKTCEIIKKNKLKLIKHFTNLGKSSSITTALETINYLDYKFIAFMDGDGQHLVSDLLALYDEINSNSELDAVVGARTFSEKMFKKKAIGNKILNSFFSLLFSNNVKDLQCGLRIFKSGLLKKIKFESHGISHYFIDAEFTSILIKKKFNFKFKNIETIAGEKNKGMNIMQGFLLLIYIIYWSMKK